MSNLAKNTSLYKYLQEHYSTTHYFLEKFFGRSFPYKKLDLDNITHLKINGIEDLKGIEDLTHLSNLEINGISDLSALEKCPNLIKIKANLPEQPVNVESILRLSQKDNMQSCDFYGRGVHYISSKQALQFGKKVTLSYDFISKLTPEQFSLVQSKYEEIHALINPNMSELEKVKTIYKNLLSEDFKYDCNNNQKGSNGFFINNTMYGPLVEHKGVCSGIAQALEHALKNEGLDAVSCGGWANTQPNVGDSHQWNQVKVDGQWYNLDLTNDYDKKSWKFFMKSDFDYDWNKCHYADKNDKFEPIHNCTSTKYDNIHNGDQIKGELNKLKQQKEQLIQQKTNTPFTSIDNSENIENNSKTI